jgi:hypothetical protein
MFYKMIKLEKLLMAIFAITTCSISVAASTDQIEIINTISRIYDKPNLKVITSPISINENFAIADWTQGNRGGRALLKKDNGRWAIITCGADELKDLKNLKDAGISPNAAKVLVEQLNQLEKSIDPHQMYLFSLFGTKNDPKHAEHHDHKH